MPLLELFLSQLNMKLQIRFNPLFAASSIDPVFLLAAAALTLPQGSPVHRLPSSTWTPPLTDRCLCPVRLPREHHPLHEAPGGGPEADVLRSQGHRQHGAGEQVRWRWRIIPKPLLAGKVFLSAGGIDTGADLLPLIWKCLAWMTTFGSRLNLKARHPRRIFYGDRTIRSLNINPAYYPKSLFEMKYSGNVSTINYCFALVLHLVSHFSFRHKEDQERHCFCCQSLPIVSSLWKNPQPSSLCCFFLLSVFLMSLIEIVCEKNYLCGKN